MLVAGNSCPTLVQTVSMAPVKTIKRGHDTQMKFINIINVQLCCTKMENLGINVYISTVGYQNI